MTQHFTRNTVSVAAWCNKCKKFTQHRVDFVNELKAGARKGPCLDCMAKYDAEKNVIDLDELRRKLGPKQSLLFGDAT